MKFLFVLVCSIVFVTVFKSLIKKYPNVFYVAAILLDVLFLASQFVSLPFIIKDFVFLFLQKCTLALALFVIVMYIGVFQKNSKIRSYYMPIRKELSIMACLLAVGHMAMYLSSYASRIVGNLGGMDLNVLVSLGISLILLILLIVLGVTSFDFVKKRMSKSNWKRVQWFAYPFFMLVYVHLLLFLLPAAMQGGQAAQVSVAIYSFIFIFYAIARSVTAIRSRKEKRDQELQGENVSPGTLESGVKRRATVGDPTPM